MWRYMWYNNRDRDRYKSQDFFKPSHLPLGGHKTIYNIVSIMSP